MAASRPQTMSYKVVVAIDFGTTCTGYAYYYYDGNRNYVENITTQQSWPGKVGMQAPTTVLMTNDKKFHSFGFTAEQEYEQLALDNKHSDWYYFRHFKMVLHHKKDLSKTMNLEDDKGRCVKALDVFEHAIRDIREHLETHLRKARTKNIEFSDIRWVITVPAIWRESAKAFMREAAIKGGIPEHALRLAIEPEAAAIYCKELATKQVESFPIKTFNPKSKYIILDLGGGTVDTTVHEVQSDGTLKELHAATGDAWGGQSVDEAFTQFIERLVTTDVLRLFKENHARQWIAFCKAFDLTKREFGPETKRSIIESFPLKLIEMYEKAKGSKLSFQISQRFKTNEVELRDNSLILDNYFMRSFFDIALGPICQHVKSVLQRLKTPVDFMILVGGFSESPLVISNIEKEFGDSIRIVLPEERSTAVLKGAVMYGIDPSIISSRVSPYSYGVSTQKKYNPKMHPKERKKTISGKDIVYRAYDEHIEKGQDVYVGGRTTIKRYSILNRQISRIYWKVYQSTKSKPLFCDDKECKNIGTLSLNIPEQLKSKKISLSVWMTCLGTELVAYATAADSSDPKNEVKCQCKMDFLGNPVEMSSDFTESIN